MSASAPPSPRAIGAASSVRPGAARLLALALLGLAAGCAQQTSSAPRDVGSMAYPTPVPQGNLSTTSSGALRPTDTGSMAYPTPQPQGNLGTTTTGQQGLDTGSMAYPTPQPQGNVGRTRIR